MHADKSISVTDICRTLRISRPTLYRYLAMD
jgi:predicted DNA-binding transcriptional regulator AlpA